MAPEIENLTPEDREQLETLAETEGKDPGELLRELVHEALATRGRNGALIRAGTGKLPPELSDPPPGESPSGVLDALLRERAEGR